MAPRLLQPRFAQSASTIQQYKGTATARSSSSSPASAWYQRPTVSYVKRFLHVSVELLTLLELWSVVAEQVRRGLSHHSAVRCTREIPRAPTFSASRPSATRASTTLCVFRVFAERQALLADGLVCRHATSYEPFGTGFRCDTLLRGRRLAVSDRLRRSPQSTVVFSLYQTRDVSVLIAGRCCRRLHALRFVRMSSPPARSPGDRPSWRRSTWV